MTGSLALTADGWHMATHVGALGMTLGAYWFARTRAGSDAFTFGTGKVYALAGYTSGIVLALVAGWMGYEAVEHLVDKPFVDFGEALPIAALGLVVNLVSAVLLGHGHEHGEHGTSTASTSTTTITTTTTTTATITATITTMITGTGTTIGAITTCARRISTCWRTR